MKDRLHSANEITISGNLINENGLVEMDRKYNNIRESHPVQIQKFSKQAQ